MLTYSRAPELARFLLDIRRDGRPILTGFSWGRAATLPVLPRVQRGCVVLSPARWLVRLLTSAHRKGPRRMARPLEPARKLLHLRE
jgi:hypothetical protein